MTKITFLNKDGAGYGKEMEIEDGQTVLGLFQQLWPKGNPADFRIVVNNTMCAPDQYLLEGDSVLMEGIGEATHEPGYGWDTRDVECEIIWKDGEDIQISDKLRGFRVGAKLMDEFKRLEIVGEFEHPEAWKGFYEDEEEEVSLDELFSDFIVRVEEGGQSLRTVSYAYSYVIPDNLTKIAFLHKDYKAPTHTNMVANGEDEQVVVSGDLDGPRDLITYMNNDGAGFADRVAIVPGTTIGQFVALKIAGSVDDKRILVNGANVTSDHVLNHGDKVSVTPTKIQAASGDDMETTATIRVLLICNNGTGFATNKEVTPGTSLGDFLEDNLDGDPDSYTIRVNGQIATASQRLNPGDKISATPQKVEGA